METLSVRLLVNKCIIYKQNMINFIFTCNVCILRKLKRDNSKYWRSAVVHQSVPTLSNAHVVSLCKKLYSLCLVLVGSVNGFLRYLLQKCLFHMKTKMNYYKHKVERKKIRARPGFEPGTSRTQSENHTPRPTSRT